MIATAQLAKDVVLELEYTPVPVEAQDIGPFAEFDVASVKINGSEVDPEWADYMAHYYFTFLHQQQ